MRNMVFKSCHLSVFIQTPNMPILLEWHLKGDISAQWKPYQWDIEFDCNTKVTKSGNGLSKAGKGVAHVIN